MVMGDDSCLKGRRYSVLDGNLDIFHIDLL